MNDSRDQNVDLPEGTKREKGTKFNTKSKNGFEMSLHAAPFNLKCINLSGSTQR